MSLPNKPLQEFFSKFNFQGYTYDPHKPPLEEFKRLCQARKWGPWKIGEHETAFLHAVGSGQDQRGSLPGPNLIKFFRKYEYQRFTYDLDAPIRSEFQRLVGLRGWGNANLSKVTKQFNKAVALDAKEQSVYGAGPNAIKFFREYEYQLFTYDSDASVQAEFQRLVGLRGWGNANLSKVTKQFNKAVALDASEQSVYSTSEPSDPEDPGTQEVDLLADWLRKQECDGYKYQGGLPELEFRELVDVKFQEWYRDQDFLNKRKQGMSRVGRGAWKESTEFKSLRIQFYGVVEEVFNLLLDKVCQITGFTRWQVLVGLYGQGQQGVGKQAAEIVRSTEDPVKL